MSQPSTYQKGIGNLNGFWEKLFKFVLAMAGLCFPALIALNIWYVQQAYAGTAEDRIQNERIEWLMSRNAFTKTEADVAHLELKQSLIDLVTERFPPPWLLERVENNKIQANRNSSEIDRINRNRLEQSQQKNEP